MVLDNFSVTAHLEYIPQSIDSFISLCEGYISCITEDPCARFFLKNAVDEITVNAIVHGYDKSSGMVTVNAKRCEDHILLEITDQGRGFDFSRIRLDREARSIEDLRSGGWALSILHRISGGIRIMPNYPKGSVISLNIPCSLKHQ